MYEVVSDVLRAERTSARLLCPNQETLEAELMRTCRDDCSVDEFLKTYAAVVPIVFEVDLLFCIGVINANAFHMRLFFFYFDDFIVSRHECVEELSNALHR